MKNLCKFLMVATVTLFSLFNSTMVQAKEDIQNKVYKIAVDPAYPPFSFKQGNDFVGIEIDLIKAIAENQNFKYELKFMNFDGVIPGIVSGQIDGAIDGINVTDARRKVVDFSDGYFDTGLCVVVRDDYNEIKTIEDLKDKKAAVKKATYGMAFAEEYKDLYNLSIDYYLLTPDVVLAVKNKNADFFMEDYPVISYQIKIGEHKGLKIALRDIYGSSQYAFAVKKGSNQELLKMFNQGLKAIKENGTYEAILNKYL